MLKYAYFITFNRNLKQFSLKSSFRFYNNLIYFEKVSQTTNDHM